MELSKQKRTEILRKIKIDKEESEYIIKEMVDIETLPDKKLLELELLYRKLNNFCYDIAP